MEWINNTDLQMCRIWCEQKPNLGIHSYIHRMQPRRSIDFMKLLLCVCMVHTKCLRITRHPESWSGEMFLKDKTNSQNNTYARYYDTHVLTRERTETYLRRDNWLWPHSLNGAQHTNWGIYQFSQLGKCSLLSVITPTTRSIDPAYLRRPVRASPAMHPN